MLVVVAPCVIDGIGTGVGAGMGTIDAGAAVARVPEPAAKISPRWPIATAVISRVSAWLLRRWRANGHAFHASYRTQRPYRRASRDESRPDPPWPRTNCRPGRTPLPRCTSHEDHRAVPA